MKKGRDRNRKKPAPVAAPIASTKAATAVPVPFVVPISSLTPRYADRDANPNKMDDDRFALLQRAIVEEGFLQPILVAPVGPDQFRIEDGHHRWMAAQAAGLSEVSVVLKNDETARAMLLGIGMNRLRGEIDLTTAASVIAEAQAMLDLPMLEVAMLTGFSAAELDTLLSSVADVADILENGAQDVPDEETSEKDVSATFTLEIVFTNREAYKLVRRKLRKMGKGDMARGVLAALGEEMPHASAPSDGGEMEIDA